MENNKLGNWQDIYFQDFVLINPKSDLLKSIEYLFVDMESVVPGNRYVQAKTKKTFIGGGAKFKVGDTLFARITPCLENGKIAQFKDSCPDAIGFGSTEFFVFRGKKDVSDSSFVFYLANSEKIRKTAEKSMSGASGRQRADLNSLKNLVLKVPPLPTQRRIAAILSAYDDLIENNSRRIKILEEMARMIYQEWFVKFRFPGHEQAKFVESPLGMIPAGWEVRELGDVAKDFRRSVQPDLIDLGTPYVGLEHIPRRSIALLDWGKASDVQSMKLSFKKGEILFGKIRPYFHKVAIAPVDGVCSSDAIVISAKNKDFYPLVLLSVSSDEFVEEATQTSNGTKMPRANWNVLLKYKILVPQNTILQLFNEIIFNIINNIQNLLLKTRNLRQTRDMLLPKLISGEIDVSDLDIPIEER